MTIHTHRFYREQNGRWYIDLPEYLEGGHGTKGNLEMVAGADKLLDSMLEDGDNNQVELTFSETPYEGFKYLMKRRKSVFDGSWVSKFLGGTYDLDKELTEDRFPEHVWLCPVTIYVFGSNYPDSIYFNKNKK